MGAWVWIVVAVAALAAVAIPWLRRRQQRDPGLPKPIPPVKIVAVEPDVKAEVRRARRSLHIRPLGDLARIRYRTQWTKVQRRFADVPEAAVVDADELITEVLHECGYPVEDFDGRDELVSLDHSDVVHNYRTAHRICLKTRKGETGTTEELDTAAQSYAALFETLVVAGR